jgi:hypothetical protein
LEQEVRCSRGTVRTTNGPRVADTTGARHTCSEGVTWQAGPAHADEAAARVDLLRQVGRPLPGRAEALGRHQTAGLRADAEGVRRETGRAGRPAGDRGEGRLDRVRPQRPGAGVYRAIAAAFGDGRVGTRSTSADSCRPSS